MMKLQRLSDDYEVAAIIRRLDHNQTRIAVETERAVLAELHGGCSIPLGVYAHISGDTITIDAMISDVDAKKYIKLSKTDAVGNAETCAKKLAGELLAAGGKEILDEIRNTRKSPEDS